MQCVILAGGLATRLRPLTETIPKALIPIGDFPFLYYQLHWLKRFGCEEVVLSIGYRGELIRAYLQDGSAFGLRAIYVDEGRDLKGTGGAIRLAYDQGVLRDDFLVLYGDSFLPIDFRAVYERFREGRFESLMTVFFNRGKWDKSNVWYENGQVRLYDKFQRHLESQSQLRYIDYGLSVLKREVIARAIPSGQKVDLAELFYRQSQEGLLGGYEVSERFYEVGSQQGIQDFTQFASSFPKGWPA